MSTFLIVGTGGVGGLLGGLLARAGHDVAFVARGAQLEALKAKGLTLRGPDGEIAVPKLRAGADPAEFGVVDHVLVCVKAWQVEEIAPRLRPAVGPSTTVVPLQNGVDAGPTLAAALGDEVVIGSLCHMFAWIGGPGIIEWKLPPPVVTLGARIAAHQTRIARLASELTAAGITTRISEDIDAALWEKLIFLAPIGSVGAVTRSLAGVLRAVPETRQLLRRAMDEIAAVARARGIKLAGDAVDRALAFIDSLPPESNASTYRDILAGRPSELGNLTGAAVRLGKESNVPTPANDFLLAALLPQENAARGVVR
ncbi:ketopantoate reductase family protein [Pendulispora albinea]|uniref:2-dehydropantoate 2-reductase n=1 Tax=Pendulispora albinea TaxID=2741071 RepID=A0ABZ2M5K1_9BACT